MSRIGRQPIEIPQSVSITFDKVAFMAKGPKGELSCALPPVVSLEQEGSVLTVRVQNQNDQKQRALWGTMQRIIKNAVRGVSEGFTKRLTMTGIGYRASIKGDMLILEVGFSHPIQFTIPKDISILAEGTNSIVVSGIDKQKVGEIAAKIRSFKKPEPYKGKGIAYEKEIIHRKAGKQASSAGKK